MSRQAHPETRKTMHSDVQARLAGIRGVMHGFAGWRRFRVSRADG